MSETITGEKLDNGLILVVHPEVNGYTINVLEDFQIYGFSAEFCIFLKSFHLGLCKTSIFKVKILNIVLNLILEISSKTFCKNIFSLLCCSFILQLLQKSILEFSPLRTIKL